VVFSFAWPTATKLLELLRCYFRWKRPADWLFPGEKPGQPLTCNAIVLACKNAAQVAGITKAVHPHSLRHAFASLQIGMAQQKLNDPQVCACIQQVSCE
jgi:site-specific recombinase XerD